MTTLPNLGTEGAVSDATGVGLVVSGLPPISEINIFQTIDPAASPGDPFSADLLLDSPLLELLDANKSGSTWTNTGSEVSSDFTLVDEPAFQVRHFSTPGTSGNYLSVPHEAGFALTNTIEIVMRIACNEWFHRTANQRIISKRDGSGGSFEINIGFDTAMGRPSFWIDTSTNVVANYPVPFHNGETGWIKVTWDGANVIFYTAPDSDTEPVSWTQLGPAKPLGGSFAANTSPVYIGGMAGTGFDWTEGRIYRTIIRDAPGGSTLLDVNVPVDAAALTPDVETTFAATSGQTVTITTTGGATGCILVTAPITLPYSFWELDATGSTLFDFESPYKVMVLRCRVPDIDAFVGAAGFLPLLGTAKSPGDPGWSLYIDANNEGVALVGWSGNTGWAIQGTYILNGSTYWKAIPDTGDEFVVVVGYHLTGSTNAMTTRVTDVNGDIFGEGTGYDTREWSPTGVLSVNPSPQFRILAADSVSEFEVIDFYLIETTFSELAVFNDSIDDLKLKVSSNYGRAALGVESRYDPGDAFVATSAGTLDFLVDPVAKGSLVYVTSEVTSPISTVEWGVQASVEPNQVWVIPPGSGIADYATAITVPVSFSAAANEDVFVWAVISGWDLDSSSGGIIFEGYDNDYVFGMFEWDVGGSYVEFDSGSNWRYSEWYLENPPYPVSINQLFLLAWWFDRTTDRPGVYFAGLTFDEGSTYEDGGDLGTPLGVINFSGDIYLGMSENRSTLRSFGIAVGENLIPKNQRINDLATYLISEGVG